MLERHAFLVNMRSAVEPNLHSTVMFLMLTLRDGPWPVRLKHFQGLPLHPCPKPRRKVTAFHVNVEAERLSRNRYFLDPASSASTAVVSTGPVAAPKLNSCNCQPKSTMRRIDASAPLPLVGNGLPPVEWWPAAVRRQWLSGSVFVVYPSLLPLLEHGLPQLLRDAFASPFCSASLCFRSLLPCLSFSVSGGKWAAKTV